MFTLPAAGGLRLRAVGTPAKNAQTFFNFGFRGFPA
jgi:hypothetical protein